MMEEPTTTTAPPALPPPTLVIEPEKSEQTEQRHVLANTTTEEDGVTEQEDEAVEEAKRRSFADYEKLSVHYKEFEKTWQDFEGRSYFRCYLKSLHSEEQIFFVEDIEFLNRYAREEEVGKLLQRTRAIYDKYLKEKSKHELNLHFELKKEISDMLHCKSNVVKIIEILNKISEYLLLQLKQADFNDFVKSELFHRFIQMKMNHALQQTQQLEKRNSLPPSLLATTPGGTTEDISKKQSIFSKLFRKVKSTTTSAISPVVADLKYKKRMTTPVNSSTTTTTTATSSPSSSSTSSTLPPSPSSSFASTPSSSLTKRSSLFLNEADFDLRFVWQVPMQEWNVAQVSIWLESQGFELRERVLKKHINGMKLTSLKTLPRLKRKLKLEDTMRAESLLKLINSLSSTPTTSPTTTATIHPQGPPPQADTLRIPSSSHPTISSPRNSWTNVTYKIFKTL